MKLVVGLVIVSMVAGCATTSSVGTNYVPVVDLNGKDSAAYQRDLGECQTLARQRDDAAKKAMAGAIAGALLGAIIAPKGYRSNIANRGALLGGLGGAGHAVETQEKIIKNCLTGRGYSVLD